MIFRCPHSMKISGNPNAIDVTHPYCHRITVLPHRNTLMVLTVALLCYRLTLHALQ